MTSRDGAISDNERDAMIPVPSADGAPDSGYTGRSLDPRFVSAALDFLLESGPDMTLEQVRVVDQIIDKAVSETRELLNQSEGDRDAEELQQDDDDRLGDLLVAAFQCAASHLNRNRTEIDTPDADRLLRGCRQVIDTLCVIGAKDGEPMDQQILWQELLCQRWGETAAGLALDLLLLRAQLDLDCGNGNWVETTATSDILQVVSSTYAQFPVALKRFCMDQVAALVSTFVDEGPTYQFTPRMQLQLELLKYLAAVDFLDDSDELDTTRWLSDYFPECFACCGVVLQLLDDDWKREDGVGMFRMLDMCLLVFKTVLGYSATKREDVCTLSKILTPTIVAALTHLTSRPAISSAGKISGSCLETSLYLLVNVASVIEEDACDALMKIFERLLAPSSMPDFNARPALLSGCFDAIHQILVHSSVAETMDPPLTKLLQAGGLKVPYVRYTSQQACCADSSENSSHCASSGSTKDQVSDEDDTGMEKAAPIASLLSGMDLDDSEDSIEFAVQDPDEMLGRVSALRPDAPQWFDEEDSDDDTNEVENGGRSLLENTTDDRTTSQIACLASTTAIPQWFDDTDDEDELGIELPQFSHESSSGES